MKKRMKKVMALTLSAAMVASLSACGGSTTEKSSTDESTVESAEASENEAGSETIVNSSTSKMPLSAALATMQGQYTSNYPQLMAASLIACIPMIVLYLIFQKQFIEGIATSGCKL